MCGDPNSVMPAWLDPKGPLNYREVEDIIALDHRQLGHRRSSTSRCTSKPPATMPPPVDVQGWRDPNYTPPPGATPVPACWRAPGGARSSRRLRAPVDEPRHCREPARDRDRGDRRTSSGSIPTTRRADHLDQRRPGRDDRVPRHQRRRAAAQLPHRRARRARGGAARTTTCPACDHVRQRDADVHLHVRQTPPDQPQFACTVPGHYPTMHGDFVVGHAGGSVAGAVRRRVARASPAARRLRPRLAAAPSAAPSPAPSPLP